MRANIQKNDSDFKEILTTIQAAKRKVYKQINSSLIELYWSVGQYISDQVETRAWGKGVVQELANFIAVNEPDIKGFNATNICRSFMRLIETCHSVARNYHPLSLNFPGRMIVEL